MTAPAAPDRFHARDRSDPQLSIHFWMHGCPEPGCTTWVPNHRPRCIAHEEKP